MAEFKPKEIIARHARVEAVPSFVVSAPVQPHVDHPPRSFELPTGLYVATAACYFGFLAIMASAFSSPGLIIPMAIFAIFIAMFFAVPFLWSRMRGEGEGALALSLPLLKARGIDTHTGRLSGGEAAAQMLVLPALIVLWGLAVALIVAFT